MINFFSLLPTACYRLTDGARMQEQRSQEQFNIGQKNEIHRLKSPYLRARVPIGLSTFHVPIGLSTSHVRCTCSSRRPLSLLEARKTMAIRSKFRIGVRRTSNALSSHQPCQNRRVATASPAVCPVLGDPCDPTHKPEYVQARHDSQMS